MTNRRDFLKHASLAIAGGFVGSSLLSACGGGSARPKKHLGLQLYSLRDDIHDLGIQKVLEIAAKMGYVNLEAAGYNDGKIYGKAPEEIKKMCDDLGLNLSSAHLCHSISDNHDADMEWWKQAVDCHAKAGLKYMVSPCCDFCGEGVTYDDVKRYGEYYTEVGRLCNASSLTFGYHNHDAEFKRKVDDKCVYDILLETSDPRNVIFENDVYWCQKGGANPVEYLKKYPDRIKLLHIKDETAIGASGTIDFKAIFTQFYANGMKDWYTEVERYDVPSAELKASTAKLLGLPEDQVTNSMTDCKKSADYLLAAEFV